MEWSKLIEQLEKDGISPEEANKRIREYDMIKSILEMLEQLEPTKK